MQYNLTVCPSGTKNGDPGSGLMSTPYVSRRSTLGITPWCDRLMLNSNAIKFNSHTHIIHILIILEKWVALFCYDQLKVHAVVSKFACERVALMIHARPMNVFITTAPPQSWRLTRRQLPSRQTCCLAQSYDRKSRCCCCFSGRNFPKSVPFQ